MAAFWVAITAFWILFIAAAQTGPQFVLRVVMLVLTAGLYFLLLRDDRDGLALDRREGEVPGIVWAFLVALGLLALGGVLYYGAILERSASAMLAVSVALLLVANRDRLDFRR